MYHCVLSIINSCWLFVFSSPLFFFFFLGGGRGSKTKLETSYFSPLPIFFLIFFTFFFPGVPAEVFNQRSFHRHTLLGKYRYRLRVIALRLSAFRTPKSRDAEESQLSYFCRRNKTRVFDGEKLGRVYMSSVVSGRWARRAK